MKKYFSKEEACQRIVNYITNISLDTDVPFKVIFNDVFNNDYYIVGAANAVAALSTYGPQGVFDAIRKIMAYEQENYGRVSTMFYDPEKVASLLEYIIGEETFNCLLHSANLTWNDSLTKANYKYFLKVASESKVD